VSKRFHQVKTLDSFIHIQMTCQQEMKTRKYTEAIDK
jgi:hypothetical protein